MPAPFIPGIIAGIGMLGGGAAGAATSKGGEWYNPMSWFGGWGQKEKEMEQQVFDPYAEIRPLLMNVAQQGIPGLANWAGNLFAEQLLPRIQEIYQAQRRLGVGSTPEVSAAARSARGVTSDVTQMQRQAQMQALSLLPQTAPTIGIRPEQPSMFENLLSFISPVAGAYMQSQALAPFLRQTSPAQSLAPSWGGGGGGGYFGSGTQAGMGAGSYAGLPYNMFMQGFGG